MPQRRVEILRHPWRWLATTALLGLAPKCLLCVLAYATAGTALGLGGPELCGAPASVSGSWTSWPAIFGPLVGLGLLAGHWCRRR